MGRWLAKLREAEKNSETFIDETLKTPETVPGGGIEAENFREGPRDATPKTFETTLPASTPGVTIRAPAIEVSAAEYDAHLDRMIADAEANAAEARFLAYVKTRGWVVPRGTETIFTRGALMGSQPRLLVPPEEGATLKAAARRFKLSVDTIRRLYRAHGIGRQSGPGAPIIVSMPALMMLQHGDQEALALLRQGRRAHPAVQAYLRLVEIAGA